MARRAGSSALSAKEVTVRKFIALAALFAAAGLAACGGGGGSSPAPTPPIATVAPAAYTVSIHEVGGLAPMSMGRATKSTTAVVQPILVTEPDANPLQTWPDTGGVAEAIVAPAPSPAPATWSDTTPQTTLPTSSTPVPNAAGTYDNPVQATGRGAAGGTLTFNLPSISVSQTTSLVKYSRVTLGCSATNSPNIPGGTPFPGGVAIVNGVITPETTRAASDIYVSGAQCYGDFVTTETTPTLHYPGGGAFIAASTTFSSITATSWVNTQTSNTTASMIDNGAANYVLIFKTSTQATPVVVKTFFRLVQPGGPNRGDSILSGASCVLGSCPDGT
jgi:hypothetical protein